MNLCVSIIITHLYTCNTIETILPIDLSVPFMYVIADLEKAILIKINAMNMKLRVSPFY